MNNLAGPHAAFANFDMFRPDAQGGAAMISREFSGQEVHLRAADETRHDNLSTFPDFKNIEEVPKHGVSVGPATMVDVSAIAIMELIGTHKAEAFARISAATSYESDWPSTIIRDCKDYYILADKAAANS